MWSKDKVTIVTHQLLLLYMSQAQPSVFTSAREEKQWNKVRHSYLSSPLLTYYWQLSDTMSSFHEWFKQECWYTSIIHFVNFLKYNKTVNTLYEGCQIQIPHNVNG